MTRGPGVICSGESGAAPRLHGLADVKETMMITRRVLPYYLFAVIALAAVAAPSPAHSHYPYTDDDSNYLKIVDYFAYPVAVLLEWTVARPLHQLETRGAAGVERDRTVQIGTLRMMRGCTGARPPRYCTRSYGR
jgi:hypothetical protein